MSKTFNFYCDERREISSLRDFWDWVRFSYYQNTIPMGLLTIVIIWVLPGFHFAGIVKKWLIPLGILLW